MISASQIADYCFCPRLFFIKYRLGRIRPGPGARKGAELHSQSSAAFRGQEPIPHFLSAHASIIKRGTFATELFLKSRALGICGRLDALELSTLRPIELKFYTPGPQRLKRDAVQLRVYCLMLEECLGRCGEGLLLYPQRRLRVRLTTGWRSRIIRIRDQIKSLKKLPPRTCSSGCASQEMCDRFIS